MDRILSFWRDRRPTSKNCPQHSFPVEAKGLSLRFAVLVRPACTRLLGNLFQDRKAKRMTKNANFKRRVRSRAAKTGESYTTARSHLLTRSPERSVPENGRIRLVVAQTVVHGDPRERESLRRSGLEIRALMQEAHERGAKLIQFTEGATCSPNKRVMSSTGPQNVGPADWNRFEWATLREQLDATRKLARELGLWTVLGSVHQLTHPYRPHNSLYVFSDKGSLITRYDERMLSNTKISFMYTPGVDPITFEIEGVLFGCSLGMESHFPEVFLEYEQLNVDCVLFSTTGGAMSDGPVFSTEIQGHAATNSYWITFSVPAQYSLISPAGLVDPSGDWVAQCPNDGRSSFVVADIVKNPESQARRWRRTARASLPGPHLAQSDRRSNDRSTF
jgi:predicted amidohydrolase